MGTNQSRIVYLNCLSKRFVVESEDISSDRFLKTLFSPEGTNAVFFESEKNKEECISLSNKIIDKLAFYEKKRFISANYKYVCDKYPFATTKYSVYEKADKVVYIYDDSNKYASEFILEIDNQRMNIYACEGKSDYKTLARVIREIATKDLENSGYITFHASCVDINGNGVLVIGNPGAGKSTLCLSLCKFQRARFVANDRVFIKEEAKELSVIPFSFAAKINKGTLKTLEIEDKEYAEWVLSEPIPTSDTDWDTYNGEFKMHLYVDELKKYMGIDSISNTSIKLIIVPQLNFNVGVLKIGTKYNKHIIKENCYSIFDPDFKDDWLGLRKKSQEEINRCAYDVINRMTEIKILHIEYSFDRVREVCSIINELISNNE